MMPASDGSTKEVVKCIREIFMGIFMGVLDAR